MRANADGVQRIFFGVSFRVNNSTASNNVSLLTIAQVGFSALPAALLASCHLQLGQYKEAENACEVNGEGSSWVRRAKWTLWLKVQVSLSIFEWW